MSAVDILKISLSLQSHLDKQIRNRDSRRRKAALNPPDSPAPCNVHSRGQEKRKIFFFLRLLTPGRADGRRAATWEPDPGRAGLGRAMDGCVRHAAPNEGQEAAPSVLKRTPPRNLHIPD